MTEAIITVSAGAPETNLENGVYEVTLVDISEPRTILPQTGKNAGKEVQLRDWTFALDNDTQITGSASIASGPKSKTFSWLTALLGGAPPAVGQAFSKPDLIGRTALATINIDENGWPRIMSLSAMPRQRTQTPAPAPAAAPVAPAPVRRAPTPVAPASDLPF